MKNVLLVQTAFHDAVFPVTLYSLSKNQVVIPNHNFDAILNVNKVMDIS
jgi:hypothetical protein